MAAAPAPAAAKAPAAAPAPKVAPAPAPKPVKQIRVSSEKGGVKTTALGAVAKEAHPSE